MTLGFLNLIAKPPPPRKPPPPCLSSPRTPTNPPVTFSVDLPLLVYSPYALVTDKTIPFGFFGGS